jgi:hypothetical protein
VEVWKWYDEFLLALKGEKVIRAAVPSIFPSEKSFLMKCLER